jgi:hypothetical protein
MKRKRESGSKKVGLAIFEMTRDTNTIRSYRLWVYVNQVLVWVINGSTQNLLTLSIISVGTISGTVTYCLVIHCLP